MLLPITILLTLAQSPPDARARDEQAELKAQLAQVWERQIGRAGAQPARKMPPTDTEAHTAGSDATASASSAGSSLAGSAAPPPVAGGAGAGPSTPHAAPLSKEAPSETPLAPAIAIALLAVAAGATALLRRRGRPQALAISEVQALPRGRSLLVATIGTRRMLLACTEAGVTVVAADLPPGESFLEAVDRAGDGAGPSNVNEGFFAKMRARQATEKYRGEELGIPTGEDDFEAEARELRARLAVGRDRASAADAAAGPRAAGRSRR